MKRIFSFVLVIFALVGGQFLIESCTTPNMVWCTSNGIIQYNRHTGQFEMLWENSAKQTEVVHDTVYVCPE